MSLKGWRFISVLIPFCFCNFACIGGSVHILNRDFVFCYINLDLGKGLYVVDDLGCLVLAFITGFMCVQRIPLFSTLVGKGAVRGDNINL